MKIVDIAEFYAEEGGGVKTYIHQKLEAAAQAGHEMVILAPAAETRLEKRDTGKIWWVKAKPMPFDPRYHLFYRSDVAHRILDQEQPDILEASSTWRGAWIAARWQGFAKRALILHQEPVAVYPHTLLDRWLDSRTIDGLFGWFWGYLRKLSGCFDTSVVSGDWLADRFASFGMQRPHVVPFGIRKESFDPALKDLTWRADVLRSMGLDPEHAKLLVNVSRHHPEKRLATVFDAIERANAKRPVGLIQLGTGPFGRTIRERAKRSPHVRLEGFIHDRTVLARMLASADAMLHGGAAETFGLVMAEGLCSGLPLIVPDSGGAFDMGGDAHAEIYPTGDAQAAAQAILRLFQRDQTELREAVMRARNARVLTHNEHFNSLFAHYESLRQRSDAHPIRVPHSPSTLAPAT